MAETIKGNCPHCGKPLEVPADLEEFSCMYCGERMRLEVLQGKPAMTVRCEEDLEYLREHLPDCVLKYPDHYKKLSKKDFIPTYEQYEAENRDLFERMDRCAVQYPDGSDALVREMCGVLMDAITARIEGDSRFAKNNKRHELFFEVKVVLAIFLTPMVRRMKLDLSEPFREELHRQWKERYPKEEWTPGDYDTLISGFRKFRFCFITTATCSFEGKPDDCAELTAFRRFRDGWLKNSDGGEAMIREYYEIAPAIVACIEYCDNPAVRYGEIRERWLSPCYQALQDDRPADCRKSYIDMVQTLKARYLS